MEASMSPKGFHGVPMPQPPYVSSSCLEVPFAKLTGSPWVFIFLAEACSGPPLMVPSAPRAASGCLSCLIVGTRCSLYFMPKTLT